jgi:NAD(P)-dependent dehydrogenase (short-subunit alcohol dehydrogenase family)
VQNFEQRVAVITGGASGLGLALARLAVRLGMRVVLADVRADQAEAAAASLPGEVLPLGVDVASASDMQRLVDATLAHFGVPHLVFNNAGVSCGGFIWEHSLAQWEWLLGVNLMGVVHGVRLFTPLMLAQAARDPAYEGHIVNSASMAGLLSLPNGGPTPSPSMPWWH